MTKLVSIVIPAYKAERFIVKTLSKVKTALDQTRYDYEIICVVDGTVDGTFQKASGFAEEFRSNIKVIGYKNNLGKGHAVKYGMAQAKGEIVGFIDAGPEINPNGLSLLLEHFEWYDADIIIGSKRHPVSKVIYPWQRKIFSWGYQTIVKLLFGLNVRDTQVGLKFFRREVLETILPRLLVKDFAFDIEILAVANYLGFKRIFEAPVAIRKINFGASTIVSKGFIKAIWNIFWDTLAVFYRLHILHYYDYRNRKNWVK